MSVRSLNKVQLIGNLTRDPELRYTPSGTAVCTFGLATNRSWTTQSGETKEQTEFHRIVSWNKLAELCSQLLVKGRKVYVEGRLSTRSWTAQDNTQRTTTEIVIEDMIILDSRKTTTVVKEEGAVPSEAEAIPKVEQAGGDQSSSDTKAKKTVSKKKEPEVKETVISSPSEEINPDDIPF